MTSTPNESYRKESSMKREITSHKVNGLNEALRISVLDDPGQGNACHEYCIYAPNDAVNKELNASVACNIKFQNGPIGEVGINGISNEALLAVVRDRLEGFQAGEYACDANKQALSYLIYAIESLHLRTEERVGRGVEGTQTV